MRGWKFSARNLSRNTKLKIAARLSFKLNWTQCWNSNLCKPFLSNTLTTLKKKPTNCNLTAAKSTSNPTKSRLKNSKRKIRCSWKKLKVWIAGPSRRVELIKLMSKNKLKMHSRNKRKSMMSKKNKKWKNFMMKSKILESKFQIKIKKCLLRKKPT